MLQDRQFNVPYITGITLVSALGGLLFGYDLLVISGAKEFYQLTFGLDTPLLQGWAVSCCIVGCITGAMLVGRPADLFGRTKLLKVAALLFLISAVATGFASTFSAFVVARFLGGIGMGMASTLSPMYTAEVSPSSMRGRFVSLNQLTIVIGILMAQLVNYLILSSHPIPEGVIGDQIANTWNGRVGWRLMFAAEGVPAFFFLVFMFFVPCSPRWLVKRGRDDEAEKILRRIGGVEYAHEALAEIEGTLTDEQRQAGFSDLLHPKMRRVLLMGISLAVFQQWCGINVIFNYASDILREAGYEVSGILFNLVIIGCTNLLFTFVGMALVDRIGRKPLLLAGSLCLAASYAMIGGAFYFNALGIFVFISALAAVASFSATLGPVVWVMISEIFPNRIRGVAMSIAVLSLWVSNFILSLTFPILKENLGPAATFGIYLVICLAGAVYIKRAVPETKGRSLEALEHELLDEGPP